MKKLIIITSLLVVSHSINAKTTPEIERFNPEGLSQPGGYSQVVTVKGDYKTIHLGGKAGMQARKTRRFVNLLKRGAEVEVVTWDERFSTAEAARGIRQAGGKPSHDRGRLDSAAAAVILQSYLDSH